MERYHSQNVYFPASENHLVENQPNKSEWIVDAVRSFHSTWKFHKPSLSKAEILTLLSAIADESAEMFDAVMAIDTIMERRIRDGKEGCRNLLSKLRNMDSGDKIALLYELRRNMPAEPIHVLAERIIDKAGEPMTANQITGELKKIGYKFKSKRPDRDLASIMSRHKNTFRPLQSWGGDRFRWWLAGRPVPAEPQKDAPTA